MIIDYDKIELEKVLNKLSTSADSTLLDLQNSKVPSITDMNLELIPSGTYIFMDKSYKTSNPLIRVNNPHFFKNKNFKKTYNTNMINFLNEGVINPVLLFINNSFFRLSNINVIADDRNVYFELLNMNSYYHRFGNTQIFTTLPTNYLLDLPMVPDNMRDIIKLTITLETPALVTSVTLNYNPLPITINGDKIEILITDRVITSAITSNRLNILASIDFKVKTIEFEYTGPVVNRQVDSASAVVLNNDIIYSENDSSIIADSRLAFMNGMAVTSADLIRYKLPGSITNVKFKSQDIQFSQFIPVNKFIKTNILTKYKAYPENLLTFINGYLSNTPLINLRNNLFEIPDFNISNRYLVSSFYYNGGTSNDNIVRLQKYIDLVTKIMNNQALPSYVANLMQAYDIKFDQAKSYEQNIQDAVVSISEYNMLLLEDYYFKDSPIITKTFDYAWLSANVKVDGSFKTVTVQKSICGGCQTAEAIAFFNGLHHYDIESKFNEIKIKFPLAQTFSANDTFDLVLFKNINNKVSSTNFNIQTLPINIGNFIDFEDLEIYSSSAVTLYNLPESESIKYPVAFTSEALNENDLNITLTNPYYINKVVDFVSKRQFKRHRVIGDGMYKTDLPDSFKYCNDHDRYLLFINNRLIDKQYYDINLTDTDLPFSTRSVYYQYSTTSSDVIDIYYVPENLTEYVSGIDVDPSGIINIDKTQLKSLFSKNDNMIFVNGKKISSKDIEILSSGTIILRGIMNSRQNLTILKKNTILDDLNNIILLNNDIWASTILGMTNAELSEFTGVPIVDNALVNPNITDTDIDIYAAAALIDRTKIIFKTISDYWLKGKVVDAGINYPYNYDESFIQVVNGRRCIVIDASVDQLVRLPQ